MNLRFALFITVLSAIVIFAACGGTEPTSNTSNSNSSKANTTNSTAENTAVSTTSKPAEQTTNNAPTLQGVFTSYCAAMERKDEAGIRRVYSKDTLAEFEKQMKEEGAKNLVEFLSTDQVTTALCEIRNEVITGDTAVATVRTAGMPQGNVQVVFVKEGNEWKLTNRTPDLNSVKETAPAGNSTK